MYCKCFNKPQFLVLIYIMLFCLSLNGFLVNQIQLLIYNSLNQILLLLTDFFVIFQKIKALLFLVSVYNSVHFVFKNLHLLFHGRVPVIFNSVVSSSSHLLSNVCPSVAVYNMQHIEQPLLWFVPCSLYNIRGKMIVPPFSALFTNSVAKHGSYLGPSTWAVFLNKFFQLNVFLFAPSFFFANLKFAFKNRGLEAADAWFVVYIHYKKFKRYNLKII